MNSYYKKLTFVKKKIIDYLEQIFKVYGNELVLSLEEYNLLSNKSNCLETSTAIGFILEEFITSKLEIYSQEHNNKTEIKVQKTTGLKTNKLSYDCYIKYEDVFFMVNIKVEKKGSSNDAVAAVNALYNDYVLNDPTKEKAYLILKTYYGFGISQKDQQRKIMIKGIDGYFLEEFDFSNGYKKDNRNWSQTYKANSGRLLLPKKFRKENKLAVEFISFQQTKSFLENIYKVDN